MNPTERIAQKVCGCEEGQRTSVQLAQVMIRYSASNSTLIQYLVRVVELLQQKEHSIRLGERQRPQRVESGALIARALRQNVASRPTEVQADRFNDQVFDIQLLWQIRSAFRPVALDTTTIVVFTRTVCTSFPFGVLLLPGFIEK